MPSGKNHDLITWRCLPLIILTAIIITRNLWLTLIISVGFIFSGLMFGPDLDIYSLQYKRWGWLRFIWLPYQKRLKHRSFLSHGFVIGTIIRLFYLLIICWLIAIFSIVIAQLIWGFTWNWQEFVINSYQKTKDNYVEEIVSLIIGLELGAMSHYLADNIDSWWKSRNKNQGKKKVQSTSPQGKRRRTRKIIKRKNK